MTLPTATTPITTREDVAKLVSIEYDFVTLDVSLDHLIDALAGAPIAESADAVADLRSIKAQLYRVLAHVDPPISNIVRRWEAEHGEDALATVVGDAAVIVDSSTGFEDLAEGGV